MSFSLKSGFFRNFAKNSTRPKLKFFNKTEAFSYKLKPKKRKNIRQPQKFAPHHMWLTLQNVKIQVADHKTQVNLIKLKSIFEKLKPEIPKNIPRPQIDCKWGAGKVPKKACINVLTAAVLLQYV